jgi:hypothetical protein
MTTTAEVVFSRRSDALAAVKRYNNPQIISFQVYFCGNLANVSLIKRKTTVTYKSKITLMQFCVTHVERQSNSSY